MRSKRSKPRRTIAEQAEFLGILARISIWRYIDIGDRAALEDAYYYTRYSARAGLTALHESETSRAHEGA